MNCEDKRGNLINLSWPPGALVEPPKKGLQLSNTSLFCVVSQDNAFVLHIICLLSFKREQVSFLKSYYCQNTCIFL